MTNLLMHDSRRLVLPLDTTVDALIEFDQVGFSYNGRDPVLRGISLTVRHG